MRKWRMAFVLAAVCAFCITGCGSDRDWSEEKGELVKAGKSQAFFVLDRKVRDCYKINLPQPDRDTGRYFLWGLPDMETLPISPVPLLLGIHILLTCRH